MKKFGQAAVKALQETGKAAIKALLRPIYVRWASVEARVGTLENAVDCLIAGLKYVASDDAGFNGQRHRKQIFCALHSTFGFEAIVETGTWVGDTTGYMAQKTNLPVYTVEKNSRFSAIAKLRLKEFENITSETGDSREFLKKIAGTDVAKRKTFFYLDAHWNEDLPLAKEIEIISDHWDQFVIMIDDFQVPGDEGYAYDDYSRGKVLDMRTFGKVFSRYQLTPFFPSVPSREETGAKRGCVVLVRNGDDRTKASSIPGLSAKGL